MKKLHQFITCFLLFILVFPGWSQQYRPINPGRIGYYQAVNLAIRSIQPDTFYFNGTDSICVFAANIQQDSSGCYRSDGPSWMGSKMYIRSNGDVNFYNYKHLPIILLPDAAPGDEWVFYQDSGIVFTATVTTVSSSSILGVDDSVKTIVLRAYDTLNNPVSHPYDSTAIQLSKNHGFVYTPGLYRFPDEEVLFSSIYNCFGLVGLGNPTLGLTNITTREIFDFNVGDEIHTLKYLESDPWGYAYTSDSLFTISKCLSRTESSDSIIYSFGIQEMDKRIEGVIGPPNYLSSCTYSFRTEVKIIVPVPILDAEPWTPVMFENRLQQTTMQQSQFTLKRIPHTWTTFELASPDCYNQYYGNDLKGDRNYYVGLGGPYHRTSYPNNSWGVELLYFKKGNEEYGTPVVILGVENPIEQDPGILVYPNPAQQEVFLKMSDLTDKPEFSLYNSMGQFLLTTPIQSGNPSRIGLPVLSSGIYYYEIRNPDQLLHRGKLLIQ